MVPQSEQTEAALRAFTQEQASATQSLGMRSLDN